MHVLVVRCWKKSAVIVMMLDVMMLVVMKAVIAHFALSMPNLIMV